MSMDLISAVGFRTQTFPPVLRNVVVTLPPDQVTTLWVTSETASDWSGFEWHTGSDPLPWSAMDPGYPSWEQWLKQGPCLGNLGGSLKDPACDTVWAGEYRPFIAINKYVLSLVPEWASHSCGYTVDWIDPPGYLTEATSLALPTLPTPFVKTISTVAPASGLASAAPETSKPPTQSIEMTSTVAPASGLVSAAPGTSKVTEARASSHYNDPTQSMVIASGSSDKGTSDASITTESSSSGRNDIDSPELISHSVQTTQGSADGTLVEPAGGTFTSHLSHDPAGYTTSIGDALQVLSQALHTPASTTGIGEYIASVLGLSAAAISHGSLSTGVAGIPSTTIGEVHASRSTVLVLVTNPSNGGIVNSEQEGTIAVVHNGNLATTLLPESQHQGPDATYSVQSTGKDVFFDGQSIASLMNSDNINGMTALHSVADAGVDGKSMSVIQTGTATLLAVDGSTATLTSGVQTTFHGKVVEGTNVDLMIDGMTVMVSRLEPASMANAGSLNASEIVSLPDPAVTSIALGLSNASNRQSQALQTSSDAATRSMNGNFASSTASTMSSTPPNPAATMTSSAAPRIPYSILPAILRAILGFLATIIL
ncbi:hypothetical protein LTR97_006350 [Elasticomyces elasticus]|uniref:Uncharacterized protein n=1 Tax=Elasticomyces elasticus TaxID=574655 RepID=A0AAN7WAJ7_9PEZI|nr:hypothetical protein LTR97_006350 [Elasticomyces elasticus]